MRSRHFILLLILLVAAPFSSAASLDFLHPRDGGKAKSSFQAVFKVLDTPPGKMLTVTTTLRDRETGDEAYSSTFEYLPEKKQDTFIERVDAGTPGGVRETTMTITVRDKLSGDALVSDTIVFSMSE